MPERRPLPEVQAASLALPPFSYDEAHSDGMRTEKQLRKERSSSIERSYYSVDHADAIFETEITGFFTVSVMLLQTFHCQLKVLANPS